MSSLFRTYWSTLSSWFQYSGLFRLVLHDFCGYKLISFTVVDLTMKTEEKKPASLLSTNEVVLDDNTYADEERGVGLQTAPIHRHPPITGNGENAATDGVESPPPTVSSGTANSPGQYLKHKTSQLLQAVSGPSKFVASLSPELTILVDKYAKSNIADSLSREIEGLINNIGNAPMGATLNPLRGRQRASWITQFRILSGRAFKNLYRDPALLAAHYASSIIMAGKL